MAQISANGYYRVKNFITDRYIIVVDNKSKGVDKVTTTVDLLALNSVRSWDKIESNPASVIYIEKVSGNEYNVKAHEVKVGKVSEDSYLAGIATDLPADV